jgi:hypothetical protein
MKRVRGFVSVGSVIAKDDGVRPLPSIDVGIACLSLSPNTAIFNRLQSHQFNRSRLAGLADLRPMIRIVFNSKASCTVRLRTGLGFAHADTNLIGLIDTKWRTELAACPARNLNILIRNGIRLTRFDLPRPTDLQPFLLNKSRSLRAFGPMSFKFANCLSSLDGDRRSLHATSYSSEQVPFD